MTPSITNAHVCGPLGQALAVVGGETWLYEGQSRRRPTNNEIRLFFQHGLEVRQFDPLVEGILTEEKLLDTLAIEEQCFDALHGLLAGMDPELTDDLRRRNMRAVNRILIEKHIAEFLELRFLRPLPAQSWDLLGAISLASAEKLTLVERLYTIVGQPLLHRLEDEIVNWAHTQSLTSVERAANVDAAYESGLMAAIATSLHDGNPTRMRERVFFAKNAKWNRQLAAHLVVVFAGSRSPIKAGKLTRHDEDEQEAVEALDADIIAHVRSRLVELLDEFAARKRREGHRHRAVVAGADALGAALRQIEWIIKQFKTGHSRAGWSSVVDLARQQLTEGDPHKLAMSLTSLSTRLTHYGETPFALYDLAEMCAPDDPAVRTARAELFRSLGRLSEALAAYDRTIEDFSQNVVARNGRAETLRALGRLDEALAAYDRTIEDFPQAVYARNGRAETLRALGRFDEALAAYDRTVEYFPHDAFARNGRAETLRALGRFDEALAAYDRAIEDFPQDAVARSGRAETLRALNRLDEALTAYDRAVEDFPQEVYARAGRAETLRALGRFDEALAAYDRTIEDFPQDAVARNGRAETLRALGRFDEALAAYDGTVEDFPQNVVARSGRAEMLRALGRFDEALAAYDRTIEDFPQDAVARNGRAETLRSLGRFDEALAAYDRTVEDFPREVYARAGRAETLRSLGRFDDALAAYDRTVEGFPQEVYARTGRAETLRALGRLDEALAAYDRAVEGFRQNVVVRNGRAGTLRSLGRFDEALAAYDRTVEDFPQNVVARCGRAETLRALGRFDEALAAYDRTIKDFPRDAVARNGYAAALVDAGKFDEARALLGVIGSAPRLSSDWIGVHILCMIEFRQAPSTTLAERIERYASTCPPEQRRYFRSTLAVVRIALKQMREAQLAIKSLAETPEFDASERAAVQLMEAHVNAAEGHIDVARKQLLAATNIVSIKEFQLRRLQQEVERRFGLGKAPPLTKPDEIQAADRSLIRIELDFWVGRATRGESEYRKAA